RILGCGYAGHLQSVAHARRERIEQIGDRGARSQADRLAVLDEIGGSACCHRLLLLCIEGQESHSRWEFGRRRQFTSRRSLTPARARAKLAAGFRKEAPFVLNA